LTVARLLTPGLAFRQQALYFVFAGRQRLPDGRVF
jgi:hypothetical protein